jgi:hypothetical protein
MHSNDGANHPHSTPRPRKTRFSSVQAPLSPLRTGNSHAVRAKMTQPFPSPPPSGCPRLDAAKRHRQALITRFIPHCSSLAIRVVSFRLSAGRSARLRATRNDADHVLPPSTCGCTVCPAPANRALASVENLVVASGALRTIRWQETGFCGVASVMRC